MDSQNIFLLIVVITIIFIIGSKNNNINESENNINRGNYNNNSNLNTNAYAYNSNLNTNTNAYNENVGNNGNNEMNDSNGSNEYNSGINIDENSNINISAQVDEFPEYSGYTSYPGKSFPIEWENIMPRNRSLCEAECTANPECNSFVYIHSGLCGYSPSLFTIHDYKVDMDKMMNANMDLYIKNNQMEDPEMIAPPLSGFTGYKGLSLGGSMGLMPIRNAESRGWCADECLVDPTCTGFTWDELDMTCRPSNRALDINMPKVYDYKTHDLYLRNY